jgi:hypothetical protein
MRYTDMALKERRRMADQPDWTISIRIPADLATWVKSDADKQTRSYNGEIVHLLKIARATVEAETDKSGGE